MANDILYMLGVVAVGFALNFGLRALPFALFGGRNRELPRWVRTLSAYISPVIIAGLIVYAYSGSAWRTAWPYLAGALTVALQLWKRNPLLSIVAGTCLYMLLLNCCGCVQYADRSDQRDERAASFRLTRDYLMFEDRPIDPRRAAKCLEDSDVPKDWTIYILVDNDVTDLRPMHHVMAMLRHAGYRHPMMITKQHEEISKQKAKPRTWSSSAKTPAIRYKGANE